MSQEKYYLKPNIVLEPLIDQWYAWTHLVFPPTAGLNFKHRHLKIMNSYVQAPQIHAAAAKNPKMLGGPFMNYEGIRKEEVKELINNTKEKRAGYLALADAIHELDAMLLEKGDGYSLEHLYEEVPDMLKGYVELNYDLNSRPMYKLIEPLIYKSELYDESAQSIAIWETNNDERPFVLSTARLQDDNVVELRIPFASPIVDKLHKMKTEGGDIEALIADLDLTEEKKALFRTFFTTTAPRPYEAYKGDKVRMRYFGHACILLETENINILVDPVISYYGYQAELDRYSMNDLPDKIDYVMITHNHQDHILFETMLSLRHKVKNIIVPKGTMGRLQDPNLKIMFNVLGFNNIIELGDMETLEFADARITGLPFLGEHGDLDIHSKLCYHIHIGNKTMMFMADSCNIEPRLYDHVVKHIEPVDVIFLGMECDGAPFSWVYGPLINGEVDRDKDTSRRLAGSNYERGRALVDTFQPKELYVYAMGLEPWVEFISSVRYDENSNPIQASNKLIAYCDTKNIMAERLYGEKEILYSREMQEEPAMN